MIKKIEVSQTDFFDFILEHFKKHEFGSQSSLTIGFLKSIGLDHTRWMKLQSQTDISSKFMVRRNIGVVMKKLCDNGYFIKFTNTTWRRIRSVDKLESKSSEITFCRTPKFSLQKH